MVRKGASWRLQMSVVVGVFIGSLALSLGGLAVSASAEQFIVSYDKPQSGSVLQGKQADGATVKLVDQIANNRQLVVKVDSTDAAQVIADLEKQPGVKSAEVDHKLHVLATTPNDTYWSLLWGMSKIGFPATWDAGAPDTVVMAVIDTGSTLNHPDLVNQFWTNSGEIAGNGVDDDGNGYVDDVHGAEFITDTGDPTDDHGHGTHVSGTIAAEANNGQGIAGIAPNAKIMALRFLGSSGGGYNSDAVQAIDYAIAKGAKVINASWGGGGADGALSEAITRAQNAGILFVAAAGNSSLNADYSPMYPAAFTHPNIVSVAATDSNDGLASFSNYGATSVDLGAPGVNIASAYLGGGYVYMSGTSMASPHVAGVATWLWGLRPSATYAQIKAALMNGAAPVAGLSGKTVSGRRLDAGLAFAYLKGLVDAPSNTSAPVASWAAGKLSCTTGAWDPAPARFTYRWTRGGSIVTGATSSTLVLKESDQNADYTCKVSAYSANGLSAESESNAINPSHFPPVAGRVMVSGQVGFGATLTCDPGHWLNGTVTFTYQWKRDGVAIDGATTNAYVLGNDDNHHSLTCIVEGTNEYGTTSDGSNGLPILWEADTTAPLAPLLTSKIPLYTTATSASFKWQGERKARFYCSLSGGNFEPCPANNTFSNLAEGSYDLTVKQMDQAGNWSPESKTIYWTVDRTAPNAPSIGYSFDVNATSAGEDALPAVTRNNSIFFFFTGDASSVSYCSLDSARYSICSLQKLLINLRPGTHTFKVKQVDMAGNSSAASSLTWSIDTVAPRPPKFTSKLPRLSALSSATVSWNGETGASSECSLNGGAWVACSSPQTFDGLSSGTQSLQVRQTDAVGNVGSPALMTWRVLLNS